MKRTGSKAFVILLLMAALAMSLAVFMSCTVDDEDTQNALPTGLGEGITDFDPPPVNPGMTLDITPDTVDYTVTVGYVYSGGTQTHFYARGGKAPYTWSHRDANMGNLTPVDEFNDGVLSKLTYTLRTIYFGAAGEINDTIIVTDGDGNVATATVTITAEAEEEEEAGTPSISPPSASVQNGNSITLVVSGGTAPYTWTSSLPANLAFSGGVNTGSSVILDATNAGPGNVVVTVTVRDANDETAVSTITVTPP